MYIYVRFVVKGLDAVFVWTGKLDWAEIESDTIKSVDRLEVTGMVDKAKKIQHLSIGHLCNYLQATVTVRVCFDFLRHVNFFNGFLECLYVCFMIL